MDLFTYSERPPHDSQPRRHHVGRADRVASSLWCRRRLAAAAAAASHPAVTSWPRRRRRRWPGRPFTSWPAGRSPAAACSAARPPAPATGRAGGRLEAHNPRWSGPFDARGAHRITTRGDWGHRVGLQSTLWGPAPYFAYTFPSSAAPSRRRDCHVDDTPCFSLYSILKRPLKAQGGCHHE